MRSAKPGILIIGAGAAGLNAALHLKNTYQVTILEARDRIGGRIHTVRDAAFTFPVETGPEFIHGELPETLELIKKYQLEIITAGGIPIRLENGKLTKTDFYFDHWDEFVEKLKNLTEDIPVDSFLAIYFNDGKYEKLRSSIKGFAEGYDAADTRLASTFALRDEWLGERDETQFRLAAGYGELMRAMADEFRNAGGEIVLNAVVNKMEWEKNKVTAFCTDGKNYHAEKAIITLPVGLMQAEQIEFSPPVFEINAAFKKLGYGPVIKILIEFEKRIWDDVPDVDLKKMGFLFTGNEIPTWWTQFPSPKPLLTGWLAGPNALKYKNTSDEDIFTDAVKTLANAFGLSGRDIISKVKAKKIINWPLDEFAMGAYSYATVGAKEARKRIIKGEDETLWFAGEAIYEGKEMGTVEAAMASGKMIAGLLA